MDNRIQITSISIKNFRSIRRLNLKVSDFNIFVGENDAGKSNVLKALNLFFNNKTDGEHNFEYNRDFTYLYPTNSKEAKAITITLHFYVPKSFSGGGTYIWTKRWDRTGLSKDAITKQDGTLPPSRSRIPAALRKIKFRYVPAVKSADYYKTLLEDLYASVSASLDPTLEEAVKSFSDVLSSYTKHITADVFERLNLSSVLTVPTELNEIFKALIFRTNRNDKSVEVPLTSRGDGIQARHIPIILKYIADEDQRSRNQGSTKVTTIWGFEEPENGLELSNAFSMASEFSSYSKDVQIFLTTHSPAFYMKKGADGVNIFYVEKKTEYSEETVIVAERSNNIIAAKMGLMPLVAPFVAEQASKLAEAQKIYNENYLTDVPTILVEGPSDKLYLELAIEALSPQLHQCLKTNSLRIVCKNDGAGCGQLVNWVMAWIYSGFRSPMLALFDKDTAGSSARTEVLNSEAYKTKSQLSNVKIMQLEPSDAIIGLYNLKINIDYEIENLLSNEIWEEWKQKKLITERSDVELMNIFGSNIPRDKSLNDFLNYLREQGIQDYDFLYKPKALKKMTMANIVKENFSKNPSVYDGFIRTITSVENYFGKALPNWKVN